MTNLSTDEMESMLRTTLDVTWNGRNPAAFDEIVTDDFVMHDPMGDKDIDGSREMVQAVLDGTPDLTFTIKEMFARDDSVVVRYVLEGTNEAPSYLTQEPTGNHWRSSGISIYHFEDGEVAEQWDAFDYLGTMQQLGLIPSEAPTEAEGGTGAEV